MSNRDSKYFLGGDLGYQRDSSALSLLERRGITFHLVRTLEWKPRKGKPLIAPAVRAEMILFCHKHGIDEIALDSFSIDDAIPQFLASEIRVFELEQGIEAKFRRYQLAKELISTRQLTIPRREKAVVKQLKASTSTPLSGGHVRISVPRTALGHGDIASAFIAAVWLGAKRTGIQREMFYGQITKEMGIWREKNNVREWTGSPDAPVLSDNFYENTFGSDHGAQDRWAGMIGRGFR